MSNENLIRGAGVLFVVGGLLAAIGLFTHPPGEGVSIQQTMGLVQAQTMAWTLSHWLLALGFLAIGTGSLLALVSRHRVASSLPAVLGFALVAVLSLPIFLVLGAESTVLVNVALANDTAAFTTWYGGFVAGIFPAIAIVSLAFVLVTTSEARAAQPVVPAWMSAIGALGAVLFFIMPVSVMAGVPGLSMLFLGSLLVHVWFIWTGVNLARAQPAPAATRVTAPA